MDNLLELRAVVSGIVQGVFFRAAVAEHAEQLGLVGTVKNLPDGTVEICAQGTEEELETLLGAIRQRPGGGRVDKIETVIRGCTGTYNGFSVVR